MKAHGSSSPSRVKDSSVAVGILENVCGFGEGIFVGEGGLGRGGVGHGHWFSFDGGLSVSGIRSRTSFSMISVPTL